MVKDTKQKLSKTKTSAAGVSQIPSDRLIPNNVFSASLGNGWLIWAEDQSGRAIALSFAPGTIGVQNTRDFPTLSVRVFK